MPPEDEAAVTLVDDEPVLSLSVTVREATEPDANPDNEDTWTVSRCGNLSGSLSPPAPTAPGPTSST